MNEKIKINWVLSDEIGSNGDIIISGTYMNTFGMELYDIHHQIKPQYIINTKKYDTGKYNLWSFMDYTDKECINISNKDYRGYISLFVKDETTYMYCDIDLKIPREIFLELLESKTNFDVTKIENKELKFYISVFLTLADVMQERLERRNKYQK